MNQNNIASHAESSSTIPPSEDRMSLKSWLFILFIYLYINYTI